MTMLLIRYGAARGFLELSPAVEVILRETTLNKLLKLGMKHSRYG